MNTANNGPTETMDPLNQRQLDILSQARGSGRVMVDDLATEFDVTPQTIRKDLNELCNRGLLARVHGGAVVKAGVSNFGYEARRRLAVDEKRLIGQAAAGIIPDECTILINIGTTTEQVALALRDKKGLLVITNNINVVNILGVNPNCEVIVAGGLVRQSDGGIVGEAAVDFIRQFKVDFAIVGVSAIDPDGTLLDYDYREVKVAMAIMENARHTILVADHSKLERSAPVRIGHLSQVNTVVTDAPLPDDLAQLCHDAGTDVIIAEEA